MSRGGVGIQSHHYAMYRGSQRLLCVSVWQRWPMSRGGVHRYQPSRGTAWSRAVAVSGISAASQAEPWHRWSILIGTVSGISGAPLGAEPWHRWPMSRGGVHRCQPMSRAVAVSAPLTNEPSRAVAVSAYNHTTMLCTVALRGSCAFQCGTVGQ
jgi:hypothetical protein